MPNLQARSQGKDTDREYQEWNGCTGGAQSNRYSLESCNMKDQPYARFKQNISSTDRKMDSTQNLYCNVVPPPSGHPINFYKKGCAQIPMKKVPVIIRAKSTSQVRRNWKVEDNPT